MAVTGRFGEMHWCICLCIEIGYSYQLEDPGRTLGIPAAAIQLSSDYSIDLSTISVALFMS